MEKGLQQDHERSEEDGLEKLELLLTQVNHSHGWGKERPLRQRDGSCTEYIRVEEMRSGDVHKHSGDVYEHSTTITSLYMEKQPQY